MSHYRPGKFIDFHVHVFPDDVAPKAMELFIQAYHTQPLCDGTVAATLAHMEKAGIDLCVPQPVATKPTQVQSINNWALDVRSEHMFPFGCMHPDYPDPKAEIDRLIELGFRGIKLQPNWQEFYPDEERLFPIYEAAEGRLTILFHAGQEVIDWETVRGSPDRFLKVHKRFPGLTMVLAHLGGYRKWNEVEEHLIGTGVYFDISFTPENLLSDPELIRLLREHGTDKIVFASDFPIRDPGPDAERLCRMDLTNDEKEDIAWRNATRLLEGRCFGT